MKTPVLIIAFNRPEHVKKVLTAVAAYAPDQLFVFQDGARAGNALDVELCAQVNAIFEQSLPWGCTLKTNFQTLNLGCGRGPSTAISWFFEHVEEGIILEDDCLAHTDFFVYCEELLQLYRDNDRIGFIGGTNFQQGIQRGDGSYYFSAGHHGTWGWATWKKVWNQFQYKMNEPEGKVLDKILRSYFYDSRQIDYWKEIWEHVVKDRFSESCWDYQFYMTCWKKQLLAIIPNQNLISNIGFDEMATHTSGSDHQFANNDVKPIFPLIHPNLIVQDKKADFYLHKTFVQSYEYGLSGLKRTPMRINKKIKKKMGVEGSWINYLKGKL